MQSVINQPVLLCNKTHRQVCYYAVPLFTPHLVIANRQNVADKINNIPPQSTDGFLHRSLLQAECSQVVQSSQVLLVKCPINIATHLIFVHLIYGILHDTHRIHSGTTGNRHVYCIINDCMVQIND